MNIVVLRGGGDIATGIGHRLFKAGFKLVVIDIEKPTTIRRKVSFAQAIYSGEIEVEGVRAVLAKNIEEAYKIIENGDIPVLIDKDAEIVSKIKPMAVVDSILAGEIS